MGVEPAASTPEQAGAYLKSETEKYAKRFQDMLGEKNISAETLKDKDKVRELLNSDRARDLPARPART